MKADSVSPNSLAYSSMHPSLFYVILKTPAQISSAETNKIIIIFIM